MRSSGLEGSLIACRFDSNRPVDVNYWRVRRNKRTNAVPNKGLYPLVTDEMLTGKIKL
jgi:hypothetical protein